MHSDARNLNPLPRGYRIMRLCESPLTTTLRLPALRSKRLRSLAAYGVPWKGTIPQRVRIPPGKLSLLTAAIGADDARRKNKDMEEIEYDVGLSFAGEQRDYVRRVAEDLQYRGLRVFYDENEEDQLWGKNLLDYLSDMYLKRCRYCIIFASAEYADKMWPNLERRSAQARDISGAGDYILPVRFDDTEIPGLLPTVYYQDARKKSPEQIAGLFAQKIGQATPARIEFAILSTEAQFDPLTLKMPGYNKMWPQERASLFTTVKVVFDAGERPCAQLTIVARDPGGNSVGEYSGWFTDSGIHDTVAGLPNPLAEKKAFVNSLLMGGRFLFGEVGTYTVSWYLNGALHSTTLMGVDLPEESS